MRYLLILLISLFALPLYPQEQEPIIIEIMGEGDASDENFTSSMLDLPVVNSPSHTDYGVNVISMPDKQPKAKKEDLPEEEITLQDEVPQTNPVRGTLPYFYKRTCFYGEGSVYDERPIVNMTPSWPFKGSYVYFFPASKEGYLRYMRFQCPAGTTTITGLQSTPTLLGRGGAIRHGQGCFIMNRRAIADRDHNGIFCYNRNTATTGYGFQVQ